MLKSLLALGIVCITSNNAEAIKINLHEKNKLNVKENVQSNIQNLMNLG